MGAQFDVQGDYGWNLKMALSKEFLESRDLGITASAVGAYKRFMGRQAERREDKPVSATSAPWASARPSGRP